MLMVMSLHSLPSFRAHVKHASLPRYHDTLVPTQLAIHPHHHGLKPTPAHLKLAVNNATISVLYDARIAYSTSCSLKAFTVSSFIHNRVINMESRCQHVPLTKTMNPTEKASLIIHVACSKPSVNHISASCLLTKKTFMLTLHYFMAWPPVVIFKNVFVYLQLDFFY